MKHSLSSLFFATFLCMLGTFFVSATPAYRDDVPPIFYTVGYNLGIPFLTKLQPLQGFKYAQTQKYLMQHFGWIDTDFIEPAYPSDELLETVHSLEYVKNLEENVDTIQKAYRHASESSTTALQLTHPCPLAPHCWIYSYTNALQKLPQQLPHSLLARSPLIAARTAPIIGFNFMRSKLTPFFKRAPMQLMHYALIKPLKLAVAGTVEAVQAALDPANRYRAAINLAGGYNRAYGQNNNGLDEGQHGHFFADVPIALKTIWHQNPELVVLYVDGDMQPATGVEVTLLGKHGTKPTAYQTRNRTRFFMLDIYGTTIHSDERMQRNVRYDIPIMLSQQAVQAAYLIKFYDTLVRAIEEIQPDLIIYNAGTSTHEKERFLIDGKQVSMNLTDDDIMARDLFVFEQAHHNDIPIVMTNAGGTSAQSGNIIGKSLANIFTTLYGIRPHTRPKKHF